jgi:hypothetical protein
MIFGEQLLLMLVISCYFFADVNYVYKHSPLLTYKKKLEVVKKKNRSFLPFWF